VVRIIEEKDAMDFGSRLRTMRAVRNLTQIELADVAMTTQFFISAIESGKMLPSPDLEVRLRKALNWTELEDEAFAILGREEKPA